MTLSLSSGTKLGDYEIVAPIGKGGIELLALPERIAHRALIVVWVAKRQPASR